MKLPDGVLKHVVIEKLRHITYLSNCAAMSVEALRSYRLMEAEITDLEITWRKPSKRAPSQALILKAYVRRVFRSLEDPAVTRTLRDVMKPAGCGAFKDVFVLDGHLLVVKMMLRDRSLGTWMQNLTSTMTSFRTGWVFVMARCIFKIAVQLARMVFCSKETVCVVKKCRACRLPMRSRPSSKKS